MLPRFLSPTAGQRSSQQVNSWVASLGSKWLIMPLKDGLSKAILACLSLRVIFLMPPLCHYPFCLSQVSWNRKHLSALEIGEGVSHVLLTIRSSSNATNKQLPEENNMAKMKIHYLCYQDADLHRNSFPFAKLSWSNSYKSCPSKRAAAWPHQLLGTRTRCSPSTRRIEQVHLLSCLILDTKRHLASSWNDQVATKPTGISVKLRDRW